MSDELVRKALQNFLDDHKLTAQSTNALKTPSVEPRFSLCFCSLCVYGRNVLQQARLEDSVDRALAQWVFKS